MLALVGIGALVLPSKCVSSGNTCLPSVKTLQAGDVLAPRLATAPLETARSGVAIEAVPSEPSQTEPSQTEPAIAKSGAPNLIAATFETLKVTPSLVAPDKSGINGVNQKGAPETPGTRIVRTISIRADAGKFDLASISASGGDASAPIILASTPVPVVTSPAIVDAVVPAPVSARPAPKRAVGKGSKNMEVIGRGVTVRAGPGRAQKSLFSLAAGKTVTVTGDHRGWLKITDGQGRTGWAYGNFLKKI